MVRENMQLQHNTQVTPLSIFSHTNGYFIFQDTGFLLFYAKEAIATFKIFVSGQAGISYVLPGSRASPPGQPPDVR
jgi:hypothetical protein